MEAQQTEARSKARRLAYYLHAACRARDAGMETVSSGVIGEWVGANSSQVRRDVGEIESFAGKRGVGYNTGGLIAALRVRLGATEERLCVVVGADAEASPQTRKIASPLAEAFGLVTHAWCGPGALPVMLAALAGEGRRVDVGVVVVTNAEVGQAVTDRLVSAGARVIYSTAGLLLTVPRGVRLIAPSMNAEIAAALAP